MPAPATLFHLAFPVHDLKSARRFYVQGLGCRPGRASDHSLILNLRGNQIVAQRADEGASRQKGIYPRHFGLVFRKLTDWQALARRVAKKGLKFYQKPRVRYEGTPIEHRTFFLEDPSGNLLEFKHYSKSSAIFGLKSYKKVGDRR
ncbi:MAG TPA: VOC family protein [bacterium]|nr:VOC family protein [bacterium]